MVNTTQYLQLPTYSDLDGHNVMLSYTSIPSYVTYDSTSRKFTFNPKTTADFNFGEQWWFNIILSDSNKETSYKITLNILNQAPTYQPAVSSPVYGNLIIPLNTIITIPVPHFIDPDGSDCKVLVAQMSRTTALHNVNIAVSSPAGPIVISPVLFGEVGIH